MIWILIAVLLMCSAAVSGSETALFALTRAERSRLRRAPHPLQRRVHELMRHPRHVLMTVLIANTGVNVAIFATSYLALEPLQGKYPALAAVGGTAVLLAVILCGEVIPKALALVHSSRVSGAAAGLVTLLQTVLGPVLWVLSVFLVDPLSRLLAGSAGDAPVTTEELRLLVHRSAHQGVISSKEHEMLQSVVAMGNTSVREIMTPRVDIEHLRLGDRMSVKAPRLAQGDLGAVSPAGAGAAGGSSVHGIPRVREAEAVLRALREAAHRYVVVCGRDLDDVVAFLPRREVLLRPDAPLAGMMRSPRFAPEQCTLLQLIRLFRVGGMDLAIVVDEYGGTRGLVTMKDVLETIVGDLPDEGGESDTVPTEQLDENTYRLSGDLGVRSWAQRFGVREIDRRVDTLGGLVLSRLGRMPQRGDQVRLRNLTITVDEVRRRRITRLIVRRDEPSVDPDDSATRRDGAEGAAS
jgi:putative hemolysin